MKVGDKVKIINVGANGSVFEGKIYTLKGIRVVDYKSGKLWEMENGMWFWEKNLELVKTRSHPLTDFFKK